MSIAATEEEMSHGWETQYTNWTTPYAMARLLQKFYHGQCLSDSSRSFLMRCMTRSSNSANRIKGLLPAGTVVAHKTGTSNNNEKGMYAAVNDVGIVTLPNGNHFAMVVLVSNTTEKFETNEKIIAQIARAVYDDYVKNGSLIK
jgi:beta-lactamase class A